jgi:CubicO group peptidase (beta-lactamase class C family)
MKRYLIKFLRTFVFLILGLFIAGNLFIVLSGRYYLYSGIAKTYLRGESGPGIYDLELFPKTTLNPSKDKFKWIEHPKKNRFELSKEDLKYHSDWGTTAFLVIHKDSVLFEKYWGEHTQQTVSNSFSVAKTIVSLLIGIALDEGHIKSLDDPAGNYVPAFKNLGRNNITIRHLLLMSSGLKWEESGSNPLSEAAEGYFTSDLYSLATTQLVEMEPGKRFNYQSGNSQILGMILANATKMNLSDYMESRLWKKIGASSNAYWSMDDENGREKSFCCFYATARDYALLGRLVLNKGNWNGTQLISKKYMEELVQTPDMLTDEGIPNQRYGLHTWIYKNQGNPVYYFRGFRGQYVLTIPKDELIIVRLGMKREQNYNIPQSKKKDLEYVRNNLDKVGHSPDIFRYIANGYSIYNFIK